MNFDAMNLKFVIAAYSVMWIVVLGFLTRLVFKGGRAREEYDRMASSMSRNKP
jgi:hypothetical protein